MATPLFRNAAVKGGTVTGLPHARIQTEVAHQLLGRREASDIPYSRQHTARHDGVDAADGHQSTYAWIAKRFLRQFPVDHGQFGGKSIMFAQMSRHDTLLVCRELDRKSTRLNSSHTVISYAVFCLKK